MSALPVASIMTLAKTTPRPQGVTTTTPRTCPRSTKAPQAVVPNQISPPVFSSVDRGQVRGVVVVTPWGRGVVLAKVVVDATGNADMPPPPAPCVNTDAGEFAMQGTGLPGRLSAPPTPTPITPTPTKPTWSTSGA